MALCVACDAGTTVTGVQSLAATTPTTIVAPAGTAVPGGLTIHATDSRGQPSAGTLVSFAIVTGDGSISSPLVAAGANGVAHVEWTLGQTAGAQEVDATTYGLATTVTFTATATPGTAAAIAITPHTLRIPVGATSAALSGAFVDRYGNPVGVGTTFTSQNPALVTVDPNTGAVAVVGSGGGTTYITATGAAFKDSAYVIVLKAGDPPCTGISATANLAVGEVITTGFADNGICVGQTATGGEYAIVPYYDSPIHSAQTAVALSAAGARTPGPLGSPLPIDAQLLASSTSALMPVDLTVARTAALHDRLRTTEWREMLARAPGARAWYAQTAARPAAAMRSAVLPPVGALMPFNVNANDFCSSPRLRTGRVVAVTARAVVVADTLNPPGFSDAEYQSFGVSFDTAAYPLDVATFGTTLDIDNNGGRTILFFTHAVNELGALGFVYARDLLPRVGSLGACPGSNVAELMYLAVPDPSSVFYAKSFIQTITPGTIAHEFQHVINGSRRLYVNTAAAPTEERWLNEGLSHIAEELAFYKFSGLSPRQNIGGSTISSQALAAYSTFQAQNFGRFRMYLGQPETQAAFGLNDSDDDLPTRGAAWSFLRYAADKRGANNEAAFWYSLVNSNEAGMANLNAVIGPDTRSLMRDWALSNFLDDLVPGVSDAYQQPSWNLRTAMAGYNPHTINLPVSGNVVTETLFAGGTVFARFALNGGEQAYVSATGAAGSALPKYVLLALVRTK